MLAQTQLDKQLFADKTSDKTESRAVGAICGHDWDNSSYHPKTQAALSEGFSQTMLHTVSREIQSGVIRVSNAIAKTRSSHKQQFNHTTTW